MLEIILILFNITLYANSVNNGLIVDDIKWYESRKSGHGKLTLKNWYKWIGNTLYGGATFGTNTKVDHSFRILLNCVVSILIYKALGNDNISFWAAMLYSCNPANNQTTLWLNGRRYVINIILVLTMLILGVPGLILYPLMPIFHVNSIFSPILLSPFFALLVPIFLLVFNKRIISWFHSRYKQVPDSDAKKYGFNRLIVIVKSYGFYFFKMLLPVKLLMNYQELYYWGLTKEGNKKAYAIDILFWQGITALLVTVTGLFYFEGQHFNFMLFMFLSILQWSNIVTATQTLADRYMSLPNVFMMFFLSLLLSKTPFYTAIVMLLIGLYSAGVFIINRRYKNIDEMYDYDLYFCPECASARSFKAAAMLKSGDLMSAWETIRYGLYYQPNDFKMLYQGAVCACSMGRLDIAKELISKARNNLFQGQEEKTSKMLDDVERKINNHLAKDSLRKVSQ